MADIRKGPLYNQELAEQPVTRFELWKAIAMVRSMVADVHIYHLASQNGRDEDQKISFERYKNTSAEIDQYMDELIGLNPEAVDGDR